MNKELKPCPFCGSKILNVTNAMGEWWVDCKGCAASTIMASTEEKAIEAWNRRTP